MRGSTKRQICRIFGLKYGLKADWLNPGGYPQSLGESYSIYLMSQKAARFILGSCQNLTPNTLRNHGYPRLGEPLPVCMRDLRALSQDSVVRRFELGVKEDGGSY